MRSQLSSRIAAASAGGVSSAASNRRLPEYLLAKLSRDPDELVHHGVAWNPATPSEVLVDLAERKPTGYPDLWAGLARNPNTPASMLATIAAQGRRWALGVLENPALSGEPRSRLLATVARGQDAEARLSVAKIGSCQVK